MAIAVHLAILNLLHYFFPHMFAPPYVPVNAKLSTKTTFIFSTGFRFCITLENDLCVFEINHDHLKKRRPCEINLQVFYHEKFMHCCYSEEGAYFGGPTTDKIFIFSSTSYKMMYILEPNCLVGVCKFKNFRVQLR